MVDLSGVVGDRLEKVLSKARKLVEQGQLKQAAVAYAQAASLAEKYAASASSPQIKQKRLADAQRLMRYAEQLKQGKLPTDAPNEPPARSGNTEIAEEAEGYLENARSLITQAKVHWDDIAGLVDEVLECQRLPAIGIDERRIPR